MSGQSWIHCHCCNRRPSDDLKVFFISNCEILLCGNCKEIVRLKDCPKCKAKCEYFEINKNLPQRFLILFKDPLNYAKESVNQLKHLMKFQSFQRSSYDKTVSTKWQKAGQAVVVSKKRKPVDCSNLDALIKANKILRDELQKLKAIESNCKKMHHEKDELSVGHYVTKEKMGTDTDSGLGSENSFTFITSTPKFELKESLMGNASIKPTFFRDGLIVSPILDGLKHTMIK
ncbi:unnamed protein product [Auanema sp. JU1783]|nr:unnamed protein product [Auanema sp. JU1783]